MLGVGGIFDQVLWGFYCFFYFKWELTEVGDRLRNFLGLKRCLIR